MNDPRIGTPDTPPTVTITGQAIPEAADRVHLGHGFYARLDSPHAPNTHALIAELKAAIGKPKAKPKVKADDESHETL